MTKRPHAGKPSAFNPLNLTQAIQEFYSDFPEYKGNTFILNHEMFSEGDQALDFYSDALKPIKEKLGAFNFSFMRGLTAAAFQKKVPCAVPFEVKTDTAGVKKSIGRAVVPAGATLSAFYLASALGGNHRNFIPDFPSLPVEFNNTEMWQRYVLDHELGHAVTIMGSDQNDNIDTHVVNFRECEADAYAMMRHYQRYGEQSKFPEFVAGLRVLGTVHSARDSHLTVDAIDRVIELNKQGKIKNLTPQQCRDLATKIAHDVKRTPAEEYNLTQAIAKPVMALHKNKPNAIDMVELAVTIGTSTQSPFVQKTLLRYLSEIGRYTQTVDAKLITLGQKKITAHKLVSQEPALPTHLKVLREIFNSTKDPKAPLNNNEISGAFLNRRGQQKKTNFKR